MLAAFKESYASILQHSDKLKLSRLTHVAQEKRLAYVLGAGHAGTNKHLMRAALPQVAHLETLDYQVMAITASVGEAEDILSKSRDRVSDMARRTKRLAPHHTCVNGPGGLSHGCLPPKATFSMVLGRVRSR